jgi:ATPase
MNFYLQLRSMTDIQTLLHSFDSLFTDTTMSVHIMAWIPIRYKCGAPGWRQLIDQETIWNTKQIREKIQQLRTSAIQYPEESDNWQPAVFVEISKKHSEVYQCGPYRIVYTEPPVSATYELTVVRPVKKLGLDEYHLDEHLIDLLSDPHQWVLIAWSPGEWKSTFAQALTEHLATKNLIIKTIEAPRDLQVPKTITQLSFFHASPSEIKDILLLSRPDITIFDEVRNHDDFHLYKDMRLAWIGMIGVMHATIPIDALQRFLHAVDLWSAAHVISCIVFIKAGGVHQILTLKQTVKVPLGMMAEDLARPVIEVTDAKTGEVTHEVYSFWEQVVVMPTDQLASKTTESTLLKHAAAWLTEQLERARRCPVLVTVDSPTAISVTIPKHNKWEIIWRNGDNIKQREKKLGCSITITTDDTMSRKESFWNRKRKK